MNVAQRSLRTVYLEQATLSHSKHAGIQGARCSISVAQRSLRDSTAHCTSWKLNIGFLWRTLHDDYSAWEGGVSINVETEVNLMHEFHARSRILYTNCFCWSASRPLRYRSATLPTVELLISHARTLASSAEPSF